MTTGALGTIRVLDLSQGVTGPYATRMLAGYGADVIKVERPGIGDVSRKAGPYPNDEPDAEKSGLFLFLNEGKRSLTLDLASPSGQEILEKLVDNCDLLVTSFRPASLDKLGLNPERWLERKPNLAYLAITNFGLTGPYRDYNATDLNLEGLGGLLYITGEGNRAPLRNPGNQAQYVAGARAMGMALIAVWGTKAGGPGQIIDLSIQASVTHMLENTMMRWSYAKQIRRRADIFKSSVYPCKDGYVGVFDGAGRYWNQVAMLMEEPRLMDERFSTTSLRAENSDEIDALMLPWLVEKDREEIFHMAQERRLPFGSVRTTKELVESPQLNERGFFTTQDHPVAGKVTGPGAPFRLPRSPWRGSRAPLLGEHTASVLHDLGYSPEDVVRLRQAGII